ncbi:MAG: DUF362 domain-containing protein [Anaerolineae bacterium]
MNRRTFCQAVAGLTAGLFLTGTGDPAHAHPTLAPTPMPHRQAAPQTSRVAFVRTRDRVEGIRRALALLELNPVQEKHVLLKPNYNSADPAPGSTHPDTLQTLVAALEEMGAESLTVGDRSGMGQTRRVFERCGVLRMAEELAFHTLVFDDLGIDGWALLTPEDSHWQDGFPVPRALLNAESVVQTCNLKTHGFGGHFTLSLKNSVGLVARQLPGQRHNYMSELHSSRHMRAMIAEINLAYTPDLIVLDGVRAFVNGGPASGTVVDTQVILAGTDRVAIDAVGVALLRYAGTTPQVSQGAIFEQAQIARAVELGLGVSRPEDIELITDDRASAVYAAEVRQILLGADRSDVNLSLLAQ